MNRSSIGDSEAESVKHPMVPTDCKAWKTRNVTYMFWACSAWWPKEDWFIEEKFCTFIATGICLALFNDQGSFPSHHLSSWPLQWKSLLWKTMTETEPPQMYFNMSLLKAGAKIIQKTKQTSCGTSEAHECWTEQNPMPPVAHVY